MNDSPGRDGGDEDDRALGDVGGGVPGPPAEHRSREGQGGENVERYAGDAGDARDEVEGECSHALNGGGASGLALRWFGSGLELVAIAVDAVAPGGLKPCGRA